MNIPDSTVITCTAITKEGRPCSIEANPSGYCHIHDPAMQCGYIRTSGKKRGSRCTIATGGRGYCRLHEKKTIPARPDARSAVLSLSAIALAQVMEMSADHGTTLADEVNQAIAHAYHAWLSSHAHRRAT